MKKTRERVNIERFDSLQLETDFKGGSPLRSKIVWTSDCKYDMYINAYSETRLPGDDLIFAVTPSKVEIVFINEAFYICDVKMEVFNEKFAMRDTIYFGH